MLRRRRRNRRRCRRRCRRCRRRCRRCRRRRLRRVRRRRLHRRSLRGRFLRGRRCIRPPNPHILRYAHTLHVTLGAAIDEFQRVRNHAHCGLSASVRNHHFAHCQRLRALCKQRLRPRHIDIHFFLVRMIAVLQNLRAHSLEHELYLCRVLRFHCQRKADG